MIWYGGKPVPAKRLPLCEADVLAGNVLYFEDRDDRGVEIHWSWLHAKWDAIFTRLVGEEQRGLYGAPYRDVE